MNKRQHKKLMDRMRKAGCENTSELSSKYVNLYGYDNGLTYEVPMPDGYYNKSAYHRVLSLIKAVEIAL